MIDDNFAEDSLEPLEELEPVAETASAPAPPPPGPVMPQPTFLVLPPFPIQGGVFKQLFLFFYAGLACFIGALLPFGHLGGEPGYTAVSGALALFFALLLMINMIMSMYTRRIMLGTVLLMFIPAVWANWQLVVKMKELEGQIIPGSENTEGIKWFEFFFKLDYHEFLWGQMGSGMLFVWGGSTVVALGFIFSIVTALFGGGDSDAKSAPRSKSSGKSRSGRRR